MTTTTNTTATTDAIACRVALGLATLAAWAVSMARPLVRHEDEDGAVVPAVTVIPMVGMSRWRLDAWVDTSDATEHSLSFDVLGWRGEVCWHAAGRPTR